MSENAFQISNPLSPVQQEKIAQTLRDPDAEEEKDEGYGIDGEKIPQEALRLGVNLTPYLSDEFLERLGKDMKRHVEIDLASCSEWRESSDTALNLAMQVSEKKEYPHDRASNVVYPLITIAAVQFAQRCYGAVVPSERVVNCVVIGDDTGQYQVLTDPQTGKPIPPKQKPDGSPDAPMAIEPGHKAARADRIARHMSWQCLHLMPEWEPGIDQLLHYLPIAGCAFREMIYDDGERRPAVNWHPADKFIINMGAKSIANAPRFTIEFDQYPYEIKEKKLKGEWRDCDLDDLRPDEDADQNDDQAPRCFYRHFCRMDLDGSGYEKPFIVIFHKEGKIVRIERNWETVNADGTVEPKIDFVKYTFIPNPKGGFYDVGFGWLLKNLNLSINTTINQLFDAGQWQNAPSGLIGRGVRLGRGGAIELKPNTFKKVDSTGDDLRRNMFVYEHPGPSEVLFRLLGLLIEAGQNISSVQDIMQGKMDQNIAPTTAMTLVEQGMTTFTSIFKRVHRSLKMEFDLLYKINAQTLPAHMYKYGDILDDQNAIEQDDYNAQDQDVRPVTDPKMVSDQVKRAKAMFLDQLADKGRIDPRWATKKTLEAFNIPNYEEALPPENPPPDPLQELTVNRLQLEMKKSQQDMENQRMETIMKADETLAKIKKMRADAVKAIADAEAAEAGPQLQMYQQFLSMLDAEAERVHNARMQYTQATAPKGGESGAPAAAGVQAPPQPPEAAPADMAVMMGGMGR